jgi:hydrogenase maturation protein HypF
MAPATRTRLRLVIHGAVQGVGFRPFVYRLATGLGLGGWVRNTSQGVMVEVEGEPASVESFLLRIESEKPPLASIQSLEPCVLDARGETQFKILASDERGETTALVLPDIATCADCVREIFDPSNRRFHYPFTNCTNCGPRFSIIEGLPYDRRNTTMRAFAMCEACRSEYENPLDRRFHAQPNACPACGPHLELWSRRGERMNERRPALEEAAHAVRSGRILALKGLGGFQLMVDARHEEAVARLRRLKQREEKPFALMVPSLAAAQELCEVSALEQRLLRSPESPIVLMRRRRGAGIAAGVAPGNPFLGVMLPTTPLHHLLMAELSFPIVATSGNMSDETICTDEREAVARLGSVVDLFLVHNRPIANHADDSVVRIVAGRELVMRRARGYAPLPVRIETATKTRTVLAVGADLKNTVALSADRQIFVSQHIGDLESAEAFATFQRVIGHLEKLREAKPDLVACDDHPDYHSTRFAARLHLPMKSVQHHLAHVASCMAENGILNDPVLGIAWDGTGYGTDATVWGGEFLRVKRGAWRRVAHLRTFPLPGGEAAVKEPRRSALGAVYAALGDAAFATRAASQFSAGDLAILKTMLQRKINCPLTSSAGRLFDAVASLTGLRQWNRYEGQAAMELEFAADGVPADEAYPFTIPDGPVPWVIDWCPMVTAILHDIESGTAAGLISAQFHRTLVEMMVAVARRAGEPRLVLSGGCFQNRTLTEGAVSRLRREGFQCYWHQRIPPNDGGIALGQAVMALTQAEDD